ncbi:1814_t:CDS:2 [Funneliformis geosporum]|uniref:12604_t:CDS:1 n=1 Tax=Funneliformis geosporum TaxID=1117311 RepID=A0A9W4SDH0_9GLOM|nr:12604_t:CDS:2 [Funneliformis geosporum]CAI2167361.1 1814_t:CDS:2 [Funneliformis geosporum]
MSLPTGKTCLFEFALNDVKNFKVSVDFPIFSTSNMHSWQLSFKPHFSGDKEKFNLSLMPKLRLNSDNNLSNPCNYNNITDIALFVKTLGGQVIKYGTIKSKENILECVAKGMCMCCSRSLLLKDVIVGVKIYTDRAEDNPVDSFFQLRSVPLNLINAWTKDLNNSDRADVKFIINGSYLYASSSVLTSRSEYFKTMFNGKWRECRSKVHQRSLSKNQKNNNSNQYKYEVEIVDFNQETIRAMLHFLYTNEIPSYNDVCDGRIWSLFIVSEKYLLDDLRTIVRNYIFDRLDEENAAKILFTYAWKWPDLKDPILKFVVDKFNTIRKTDGYKDIVASPIGYPNFFNLNTEILLNLYPD